MVFTYVISDFGAPKVIGGNFNVLSVDVFKQVVGQHNFSIGAVVGMLLLIPSVISFVIDYVVRRKLKAQLTARSVPYSPKRRRLADALLTLFCTVVCGLLLATIGMAIYTSLISLWPYDLSFTLKHDHFVLVESDMAEAYGNSLLVAMVTAVAGSLIVFVGAYLIEKTRNLGLMRKGMHLMAVLSMAVPGLVLGLGYVMFFNHPANPLNFLYQTMAILIISILNQNDRIAKAEHGFRRSLHAPTQQSVSFVHEGIPKTGECVYDRRNPCQPGSQGSVQNRLQCHMVNHIGVDTPIQPHQFGDCGHLAEQIATPADQLQWLKLKSLSLDSLSMVGHTSRHDYVVACISRSPSQIDTVRPEIPVFSDQIQQARAISHVLLTRLETSRHSRANTANCDDPRDVLAIWFESAQGPNIPHI